MSSPIIISGTTDSGMRFCQFWGESKVNGLTRFLCWVSMVTERVGSRQFWIDHACPDELVDEAWATFQCFRNGVEIAGTHSVVWAFGKPQFTPIIPEVVIDQQAFDLEGIS